MGKNNKDTQETKAPKKARQYGSMKERIRLITLYSTEREIFASEKAELEKERDDLIRELDEKTKDADWSDKKFSKEMGDLSEEIYQQKMRINEYSFIEDEIRRDYIQIRQYVDDDRAYIKQIKLTEAELPDKKFARWKARAFREGRPFFKLY